MATSAPSPFRWPPPQWLLLIRRSAVESPPSMLRNLHNHVHHIPLSFSLRGTGFETEAINKTKRNKKK
ncbi:uncharacterized protein LOC132787860 isoform X2 [Drosophila nasuta]|uniref:uncharacterized protein LOC132787860 isoform X2 n=1 Tax=Drosophila nasuta TaxID=42062 RepID=UPI00295EA009|nr:uncharacterized protein LOC132787860 isoform X2 [Drosophila nasuta]